MLIGCKTTRNKQKLESFGFYVLATFKAILATNHPLYIYIIRSCQMEERLTNFGVSSLAEPGEVGEARWRHQARLGPDHGSVSWIVHDSMVR